MLSIHGQDRKGQLGELQELLLSLLWGRAARLLGALMVACALKMWVSDCSVLGRCPSHVSFLVASLRVSSLCLVCPSQWSWGVGSLLFQILYLITRKWPSDFFFYCYFLILFFKINFCWHIVALTMLYFCHTAKWISYMYTYTSFFWFSFPIRSPQSSR